jgi:hypothetical protein
MHRRRFGADVSSGGEDWGVYFRGWCSSESMQARLAGILPITLRKVRKLRQNPIRVIHSVSKPTLMA